MATRWGCLGAGAISNDFFLGIKENLPADEHEFVAIAARDLDRAQKYADRLGFKKAYGSYDELANDSDVEAIRQNKIYSGITDKEIEDIIEDWLRYAKDRNAEIAYIGTNHPNHAELSIKLMNAGKHVLCEKPMTMNLKEAKQVFEAAKQNNVFFMEGIWSRFLPVYKQVDKDLAEGTIGNIRLIRSETCWQLLDKMDRFKTPEVGGGGLYSLGIYPIALACSTFEEMPESITAVGTLTPSGVDETVCILLKYKCGALVNISTNITIAGENTALIFGDKGTIKIDGPMWAPTKVTTPSGTYEFPLKDGAYNYPNGAGFQHEAAAVRNYLKAGAKEATEMPHKQSEMFVTIMDEVRRQIGYVVPADSP